MDLGRHKLRLGGAAAIVAVALAAAGCGGSNGGSGTSSGTGTKVTGGTATVALPAGVTYNWIFPFYAITNASVYNGQQFQWLFFRPLYMFGGDNTSININYPLSPANAPVYSNSGKTVTVTMKGWKWSNGESVDAKDVIFYLNMTEAEKANWYGYAPGLLPDNLVSYKATGPDTVTIQLNRAYSTLWFTYNQLAELTPMPAAWDISASGGAPGSGGCIADTAADHWAKCKAVWAYLTAQSKSAGSYATNPLWQVVDGPWKLSSFSTAGQVTVVPNGKYSGSPKPTLTAVKFVPFTADTAEYTALKTGGLDVGEIPAPDRPQRTGGNPLPPSNPVGSTYNMQAFFPYGIYYYQPNFNNPTFGAVFKQLYVRQALQMVMDQPGMDAAIWRGYAVPTSGPIPTNVKNQWVPPIQLTNGGQGPYPFNVSKATSLLTSHGWTNVGGVMTCQVPAKCGAGISKGEQLKFTIDYSTGVTATQEEVATYKSDASKAGIGINLVGQSFNTIIGESLPCKPGPKCTWDVLMYGGWGYNGPGFEPTGEPLFATGAGSNSGSYSNPTMDSLITLTHTSSKLSDFYRFATFASQQLPYIWTPNEYQIWAVTTKLHNVSFNPLYTLLPEYWYFTK